MGWIAAAWLMHATVVQAQQDEPVEEPEEAPQQDPSVPVDEEAPQQDPSVPVDEEAPQQDPSVPAQEDELSAEDLAAIEAAVAEDASALEESEAVEGAPATGAADARGAPGTAAGDPMNPDLSLIAIFALAAFSDEDEQLETGAHDPTANGFNFQQLELAVGAAVDPYFRFDANLVFSLEGVEIEEAYATTLDLPGRLQARLGQFLTRFGRLNDTHPHAWHLVDQPFALGRVWGGEGNRGVGVEISWLTPLPWYVELVGSATDASGGGTARSFYGPNDLGVEGPADLQYVTALKQFFPLSDDFSLFWGLSAAFGPNPTGRDNRTEVYGTDLFFKWRPITRQSVQVVSIQTEWMVRRRQVPDDVLTDLNGYAQLYWHFAQRWGTAVRYGYGSPAWDLGGDVAVDYLDPEWVDHRHRVGASLTFEPTEFSRLRLQGAVDAPGWLPEPVWAAFLQAEFVTGAHGAHEY